MTIVMFDTTRRKVKLLFFNGIFAFFSEIFDFNNLSGLKKRTPRFHSICQKGFRTLTNCPLKFDTLDNASRNRPKTFVTGKIAFFEEFVSRLF